MKFIDNPFITFGKDTAEFINSEFDFVKSVGIDKAIGADYKTRIVVICNDGADGEKVKKYLELLNYLDSTGLFSIAFVCGKSKCAVPEGVKLFSYTPDKPRIIINAALEANTLIIPPDVLRDIPGLKDIARKKYVVMDISSENAVTTENINGAAGASLPEEYLRLADFFICADGAQEDGLKAVLENIQGFCRALDNRVTAWQQDAGTDSGGTMKQVADFCVKPSYATPRDDRGGILELSEVADIENRPVSDGNSVFERLSNIEAQQVRLEKMIRDNIRISKGVDDEVRDVLGWTTLMNNRFDKLKYRLSKVRLIGRFFN
jgi:hypothetical protein